MTLQYRGSSGRENALHLLDAPLSGVNLVDAAAGTGKTYAIECLFLRLIAEADLLVSQILVVTYTNAATDELRDRIRRKLRDTVRAFSSRNTKDPFIRDFLLRQGGDEKRISICLEKLQGAVRDFDEASILTIHGFCRLMLGEFAFESGASFDSELISDQEAFKAEVVRDFWRLRMTENDALLTAYAKTGGMNPNRLKKLLDMKLLYPDIAIKPQGTKHDFESIEMAVEGFRSAMSVVEQAWPSAKEAVLDQLQRGSLHAGIYGPKARGLVDLADAFLRSGNGRFPLPAEFEKLSRERLRKALRKSCTAPDHPIFESIQRVCERARHLTALFDSHLLRLKSEFLEFAASELQKRKIRSNVLYFDDLLLRLRNALSGDGGELLARSIRGKYSAALVDEFQDTDPVQFAVFRSIFGVPNRTLFLIGDPKQAIYGFRGADIFAYLQAASEAETRYTLSENRRSDPDLVNGLNGLFSGNENPFVFDQIHFFPAVSGCHDGRPELRIDGKKEKPLRCWFLSSEDFGGTGKPISKTAARRVIAGAVASDIARLVRLGREGRAVIGNVAVREGDIAVLVRTNREASLLEEAFAAKKILAVSRGTANLFDVPEAEQMHVLLAAALTPADDGLLAAALSTELLGVTAAGIDVLKNDDRNWMALRRRFVGYHDLWRKRGFTVMFRSLLSQERIGIRMLRYQGGERRLANLLHLAEILDRKSTEDFPDMRGVHRWLAHLRHPETPRIEEHRLRLESDADAVQIMTIHKSKGLEYPIVYCPFLWGESRIDPGEFLYHDTDDGFRLSLDLGSEQRERHAREASRELLSENCRLLYVALTRAKHRCCFAWGRINRAGTSAPAYLFHAPSAAAAEDPVTETERCWKGKTEEALRDDLQSIAAGGHSFLVTGIPEPEGPLADAPTHAETTPRCRVFRGAIDRRDCLASYSLLVAGREEEDNFRDFDLPVPAEGVAFPVVGPVEVSTGEGIRGFPAGSRTGLFLHDLLREFDFTCTRRNDLEALAERKLNDYGFDEQWKSVIVDTLQKIVSFPFVPDDPSCRLSTIAPRDRLDEFEFHFPLHTITPETLAEALRAEEGWAGLSGVPQAIGRLQFQPMRGFMKGFVDLVFRHAGRYYLIDWKSNLLGSRRRDYGQESMKEEMLHSHYYLQCAVYTLALHLYLGSKLPDYDYHRHFGGAYYLFIRGMEPSWGPNFGVYRERPKLAAVERLAECMLARGGPKNDRR